MVPPGSKETLPNIYSPVFLTQCTFGTETDAASLATTASETRMAFETSLCKQLRAWNHARSYQDRLPTELWTSIWEMLSMEDLIVISTVCHKWRTISVNWPRLWIHIHFNLYCHEWNCSCYNCLNSESQDVKNQRMWRNKEQLGLYRVKQFAQRSAGLPVHLFVVQEGPSVSTYTMKKLLKTVTHNATGKLVSVEIDVESAEAPEGFMDLLHFNDDIRVLKVVGDRSQISTFPIQLPGGTWSSLEVLNIGEGFAWSDDWHRNCLPKLHTVVCIIESLGSFIGISTAAPMLRTLTADLSELDTHRVQEELHSVELDSIQDALSTVEFLTISNLDARYDDVAAEIFKCACRGTLRLEFWQLSSSARLWDSFELLTEVEMELGFSFVISWEDASDREVTVSAKEIASGRMRKVALHHGAAEPVPIHSECKAMLRNILSNASSLTIDIRLWSWLFDSDNGGYPAMRRLDIYLPEGHESSPQLWTAFRSVSLPNLKNVRLRRISSAEDAIVAVETQQLRAAFQSFKLEARLEKLTMFDVALSEPAQPIDDLVDEIRVVRQSASGFQE